MRVVIDKATLKRHRSCDATVSPSWDPEQQALVYEDWSAAAENFLATADGIFRLQWLVAHKLVPMTEKEFAEAKSARTASGGHVNG